MKRVDLYTVKTITEIVNSYLDHLPMKPAKLARLVGTTQQNLSKKLGKNDMDTDWVKRISDALNHNFFKDLSDEYDREKNRGKSISQIVEDPVALYRKHPFEIYIEEIVEKKLKGK